MPPWHSDTIYVSNHTVLEKEDMLFIILQQSTSVAVFNETRHPNSSAKAASIYESLLYMFNHLQETANHMEGVKRKMLTSSHNFVMFNFSRMRKHIKFISTSFESAKTNTSLITLCLINLEINSHFLGKMSVPFGQPTWQFPSSHNFTGYKTWFCTFSSQQNSPRLQHMFPLFFPDISHTNSVWQTPSPTPKKERIWNDWGNIAK